MTGGLLQLVAYGNQDALLTMNPEFTFFKSVYHRHTNFSKFPNKIILEKKALFGTINNINIPKNGDLLDNMYISVDLPALSVVYERELYEEIYYQIGNTSSSTPIKFITKMEYNNLYTNLDNLIHFINEKQYYNALTHFTDSSYTATNMLVGIINSNNLIVSSLSLAASINIYYNITKELVNSYELGSSIFNNFNYPTTVQLYKPESILKIDFSNLSSTKYFQNLVLNLFYNNNISALINYLKYKIVNVVLNTPNKFIEKLYYKILYFYTNNNYNLLSYNLLSYNSLVTHGNLLDLDYSIYGSNLIEINYDSEIVLGTSKASDYEVIFIISSQTFGLKSVKTILIKDRSISITPESILYKLHTNTFVLADNCCLSNYLNVTSWIDPKTVYTITTKLLKSNSDGVYQLTLNSIANLEINQIIFGFNNNTSTVNATPDFVFYIQNINTTTNVIECILFDNKMFANNITYKNQSTNDYNTYDITYLSSGITSLLPISSDVYKSDIWQNYIFINNSSNSLIIGLNQSNYYSQLIKYSKTVVEIQRQILINYINAVFINNYYISVTFNVNPTTVKVDDYYETSLWDSSYSTFINAFLYTDNTNKSTFTTDIAKTPEYIYNKLINKISLYMLSSNLSTYHTPYIKSNFGSTIVKAFDTNADLLSLNKQIKYLNTNSPFITILLTQSEYYNTDTSSDSGIAVATGDILHLYNNTSDTTDSTNLIGIFKVKSIDSNNLYKIYLTYESYNTKYSNLDLSIAKIDSLVDGAYLFKNTLSTNVIDSTRRLTISGNILDESKYDMTITQPNNMYFDFSSNTSGILTSNQITTNKFFYIYESTTKTYNVSLATFIIKLHLTYISPNNNNDDPTRKYVFYIDSKDDTEFLLDTVNKTYFCFSQNTDDSGFDNTKGFIINTVTINGRYFTPNTLNSITTVDDSNKGYRYTNILYNIYCMYLYNELKSSTNTAYNKIILGRLYLISNKIYQVITLNSNYLASLETLTQTIKLTYFADFTKIFNSSTIINELFANFPTAIIIALKEYMNGKYIDTILNNVATRTSYTYISSIFSKVVGTSATAITITDDDDVITEVKTYFKLLLDQLTNTYYRNVVDITQFNNITDNKLYYIAANDIITDQYINIINNIYYDDLITKQSKNIGILFNEHINDANSITDTVIRNVIEDKISLYDAVYSLPNLNTYIDNIDIRYNKSSVSTSFSQQLLTYITNETLVNSISNIDITEDLSISNNTIKTNIYSSVNLTVGSNTNFDTKINEVFIQDETNKTIYSFLNENITISNQIYDYLHKFIYTVSINQIYNIIPSFLSSVQINKIIDTNSITLGIINTYLSSISKGSYENLIYAEDSTNIYIPTEYSTDFQNKLKYINGLTTAQKTTEQAIWTKEISGLVLKIKEYYFTTGSTYKSIKSLEDSINGVGGYFASNVAPYYKLIRGCVVSDTEYSSLNYDALNGIIYDIDNFGGILKILLPFNLVSIFCPTSDAVSLITLTLDKSILRIQSNNNPAPGTNALTITNINYDYKINCRFGLNIMERTLMEKGDIGISLNGVILRNSYALSSPDTTITAPTSFYEFTIDSQYYYNYTINATSTSSVVVGDIIRLYSTSLISAGTLLIDVTITEINDTKIKFRSNYNINIKNEIYGYKVILNATSYDYGFKIMDVSVESFRLNIIPYFDQFQNKNSSYHSAIDSNNSFNYYSGNFINALSSITNTYLDTSNYNTDKLRHTDGHSKIVGIAYDGYPIYGPYGYKKELVSGDVELMKSSYRIKSEFSDNRNSIIVISGSNITYDAGTIIEDYEYEIGYGHLDESNGRYCITPEFPHGTYAYFLTFDSSMVPVYPYIIGNKFYNKPNTGTTTSITNINISSSSNIGNYSDDDIVNLIGDNGKYGKGVIKSTTNNIKYIEISDKGIHYKLHSYFYAFKEIPNTLEYVDVYKLYLRRKTRFYDGYYYDYTNTKLDLLNAVDTTDQTTFTNSINKINGIKTDLSNLISANTTPVLSLIDVYDTSKYEPIINVLNIDDIISVISSLPPEFFGSELIDLLVESIATKSLEFDDIINSSINYLFTKYKKSYKLYYTSKINISKDYNLVDLNLDKYDKLDVSDTYKTEVKDMITLFQTKLKTNNTDYATYKVNELSYLNRAPIPMFSWIGNLGNFIFDEIELYFNDLLIDTQYSNWINIWHNLNNTYDKKELLEKMIGNTKDLTDLSINMKPSKKLLIPLRFWFCRYSGFNIPLIAMPYVNINMKFEISNINNLVRKDVGTKVILGSELNIHILADYIYLDDTERKLFAEARHEYLIEQIQFNGIHNIHSTTNLIDLYFRNNVKDLYWFLDSDKNLYQKDRNNYSLNNSVDSGNPITNTKILINNTKFVEYDGTYTNYIVPYENYKTTPSDGINVYKFGLDDGMMPTGSLNFSMLDRTQMEVKIDSNYLINANKKILVFGTSYNILRVMSGLAGLAFIE